LRIEDHPEAVAEITRVLKVYRAYEHMNNGDLAIEHHATDRALQEYGAAQKMFPDNVEMKYWTAVSLVNIGQLEKALPLFKEVFAADANWKTLTLRIVPNGMLKADEAVLKRIISAQ
jgi:tetratricopeptide (TPR) repeat protein